jgi:F-type H+-transporting ATPase subunit a
MVLQLQPIFAAADAGASLTDMAVSHVLPHALHSEPLFTLSVGSASTNIPALGIYNGQYSFYITNHLAMTALTAVVVLLTFSYVAMRVRVRGEGLDAYRTKGRVGQLFETMCTFIREEVARPNLHGLTDKYIHYIWSIFFFVLFANLLGLIPIGSILYSLTGNIAYSHWGGTATGNLSLNVVLATASFIAIVFIGIRETGAKAFFAHFNPIGWDDPKMLLIGLPLYLLEWMGLIIKCVVLAMRLFGTMMAGHLVIAAFILLIFSAARVSVALGFGVEMMVILGGIPLTFLELFIAFLQAFIFTFLTVLFISTAGTHHPDDEHTPHASHHEENPFDERNQMDIDKLLTPDRLSPAVKH